LVDDSTVSRARSAGYHNPSRAPSAVILLSPHKMAPRQKASAEEPAVCATASKKGDFKSFSTSVPHMVNYFGAMPAPHVKPPVARPTFTVKDVRGAIPAHCFKRSALISGWHLLKDLATVAAFGYAATHISLAPEWARIPLWAAYIIAQGFVMTGVWVIAHECGHQSFSDSKFINDTVGWFAHSALLVPYHSWRISHSKHHKNTCSVEDDEVFAAATRSDWKDMTEETPLASAIGVFVMLFFGWCVPSPAASAASARSVLLCSGWRAWGSDGAAAARVCAHARL